MKVVVVYNPHSGSALPARELKRRFKHAGMHVEKLIDITKDFQQQLKPWQAQKKVVVAAIGGDGTLSSVAGVLAGSPAVFAPLPGGTLNHFTKDLGIPQDLDEALAGLAGAKIRKIDVASVNNRIFVNNSSIGLYPSTLSMRERLENGAASKWPAAVIATFKALVRYRTYTVTISGETFKTPFLFVGNNDYHLDDPVSGGRTRLDKGLLSVYTVASASRLSLLRILGMALIGQLNTSDEVKLWKTTELEIHTKKHSIKVACDGELETLTTPLRYVAKPQSLNTIGSW